MLEAVTLTKRYASLPAVQDLSFTLRPGQVLGCLGPNGSGKSTTVKMLIGLLQPSRGVVRFNGHGFGFHNVRASSRVEGGSSSHPSCYWIARQRG